MASRAFLVAIAFLAVAIAAPAMGKDIMVGDNKGWTLNFDYKEWAAGKSFYLGDSLVFNYPQGAHNVIKVNQTQYENCDVPETAEPFSTGNDMINLKQSGKKWYICGVGHHCANGMKLAIDVVDLTEAPVAAPAPAPESYWGFETAPAPAPKSYWGIETAPAPAPKSYWGIETAPAPAPKSYWGIETAPAPAPKSYWGIETAPAPAPKSYWIPYF